MARLSRVIDRDKGLRRFLQRFKEARGARVKVGVTESVGSEPKQQLPGAASGKERVTVLLVAWWNEFGTHRTTKDGRRVRHVPARSFMRTTSDEQRGRIFALKKRLIKKMMDGGMSVRQALIILGEFLQEKIRQKITRIRKPENAQSTKDKKGFDNPLIATGQLRRSIRYQVSIPRESGV